MISPLAELRQKWTVGALRARVSAWMERRVDAGDEHENGTSTGSAARPAGVSRGLPRPSGLLDERFFLYTEDVDFCAAIRARGRRILFTPAAEIIHLRGRSRATLPAAIERRLSPQPPRVLREAPSALGAAAARVSAAEGTTAAAD